jgi:hypothetical protein
VDSRFSLLIINNKVLIYRLKKLTSYDLYYIRILNFVL